ncbi:hypothetical protein OSTOST_25607, partial [Ostertagia ostertagi]
DFISTQRVCDPIPEEGNERKANAISDSIPVLGEPIMTSTQRPTLFLSQAVHARSDLFGREPTQEVKTYHCEKAYNYFHAKPTKTFDARAKKSDKAPWLDLPTKKRSGSKEVKQWEHGSSTSTMHDDDSVASKRSFRSLVAADRRAPLLEHILGVLRIQFSQLL